MTLSLKTKSAREPRGYYRRPVIGGDQLFFIAEGDIWQATCQKASAPSAARRLTGSTGAVSSLVLSPAGDRLFFVGTDEGAHELYSLCLGTGEQKRLTYLGGDLEVLGFVQAHGGRHLLVRSNHDTPFSCLFKLYAFDPETLSMDALPFGPTNFLSANQTHTVLGRNGYGYVTWKRYRGGTAGEIWIREGQKSFKRLFSELKSNLLCPLFVDSRLYFLSDHEGIGELYSSTFQGEDLVRHTKDSDFYARDLSSDGKRLTYMRGGDLFVFDPESAENVCVSPTFPSPGAERARLFVPPDTHLSAHTLSPSGQKTCLTTRGRLFVGSSFKGPMLQLGCAHGVRYRLGVFINETEVMAVRDEGDKEVLEIFDTVTLSRRILTGDWGRILSLKVSPQGTFAVIANHTHALLKVDLKKGALMPIDQSAFGPYEGIDISGDEGFVAYALATSHKLHELRMFVIKSKKTQVLTKPVLGDTCPVFDPKGRFLYFLSMRTYAEDEDLRIPALLTLSAQQTSPFVLPEEDGEDKEIEKKTTDDGLATVAPWTIDFEGIEGRMLTLPMGTASYQQLYATKERLFSLCEGPKDPLASEEDKEVGHLLLSFDLSSLKKEVFSEDVLSVSMAQKGEWLSYIASDKRLRTVRSGDKPDDDDVSFRSGGGLILNG